MIRSREWVRDRNREWNYRVGNSIETILTVIVRKESNQRQKLQCNSQQRVNICHLCVCVRASCCFFFTHFHMENKQKKWHQTCVWMTPTTKHKQHTFSIVREQENEWVNKTKQRKKIDKTAPNILHRFVLYFKSNNSMLASVLFGALYCCWFFFSSFSSISLSP